MNQAALDLFNNLHVLAATEMKVDGVRWEVKTKSGKWLKDYQFGPEANRLIRAKF